MESTGFYEPIYDFMESRGFNVKLAKSIENKAHSRIKYEMITMIQKY